MRINWCAVFSFSTIASRFGFLFLSFYIYFERKDRKTKPAFAVVLKCFASFFSTSKLYTSKSKSESVGNDYSSERAYHQHTKRNDRKQTTKKYKNKTQIESHYYVMFVYVVCFSFYRYSLLRSHLLLLL